MTETQKKLSPQDIPDDLKRNVGTLLVAMTHAQLMREKMDKLDDELLSTASYMSDLRWSPRLHPENKEESFPIKSRRDTVYMKDDDAKDFFTRRDKRIHEMGYDIPKDHCPALTAELLVREAQRLVIDSAYPWTHITRDSLRYGKFGTYDKYIDLLIRMVINLPDFQNPLDRFMKARAA